MKNAILASLAIGASAVCVAAAHADTYPSKPITIVVPTAAAGSTDIMARLVGEQLQQALGQPVVVDNKPGASGNIGTEAVARAAPDGYTLLMQYSGYHVGNPALFPQIRWKTSDFAPIALVMRAPHVIAVSGTLSATNLKELIAHGQKNSKGLFYASSGNGSIQHIAGEMFARQAKVPATHVPYKGAGPVVVDLISGQVDMFITTPPSVIGQVQAGKIKALAYAGAKRHPSMPNVPTAAEAGLPGYEVESWFALFAPAKTPPAVVARLTAQIKSIVESEAYKKKVEDQGAFAAYMDPPTLAKFVDQETAMWSKVIKDGNIKAD
ncbi:tripartite tricarboxylate transporter substrate binding protein [Variovorax sp. J22G21]|uniref:Bug family tripartite tricarboxylate transporter substrate binding protein n=1 Tax=Variovorax fucosicus TaxID=3053517 RepID=UPI0025755D3B|nr:MULTISPECIES: tripartite tricarboxylate transporter substrate binding protein [unclassified Variovorax]MDM0037720.1 tripartite tricarboxylate transporter substrate binding protein [Variovorax sp. J22R193]MDM0062496.1 tripartite tricarboxylate transporter substrate binding protein [Variovorax sp. J22G21]